MSTRAQSPWATARARVAACVGLGACLVLTPMLRAQRATAAATPPPLAREFRGVWVASVSNIDWPSKRTLTTAEQQAELRALLDKAAAMRLNAVIFQVRPAGDALYASTLEPWSEYLTGTQGRAPSPAWDPLAFAVQEAHARHLELHAWFNPYRARHVDGRSAFAANHIARRQPSLVKRYGRSVWMDPGEPAVRAQTLRVVLDVVSRYDIDGVHIDDYFYPYPERTRRGRPIPFPDDASWTRYRRGGGKLARDDWRRENVNLLVRELHDGIHRTKPWVRFGVSPFGIWRPGFPESVRGFDAYAQLYADARKWLREGWVDYFTPQLYWPTTRAGQAYPVLLDWWASENVLGRHLWPGNFTSLAGGRGSTAFPVSELVEQIRVTRRNDGATGNVHFSMKSFLDNQAGMVDVLTAGPYAEPALVPATPWLAVPPPPEPAPVWRPSAAELRLAHRGATPPWQWLLRLRTDTGWVSLIVPGSAERWVVPPSLTPTAVSVSALNRVGSESDAVLVPVPVAPTSSDAPSPAAASSTEGVHRSEHRRAHRSEQRGPRHER